MTVKPNFSVPFKTYEELAGASGRQVYFRPPRFRARDLFSQETARAEINGTVCSLYDLSISGLSAISKDESLEAFTIGHIVPLAILRANEPLFSGRGEVVRIEPSYRGTKIGIKFVDNIANIDAIRAKFSELIFAEEVDSFSHRNVGEVDIAYRVMCTEILEFIREYKNDLAHAERLNPKLSTDTQAQKRLLDLCEARAMPHWNRFALRANALIKAVESDPASLAAMKKLTVSLLTPEFLSGPVWWQSYMKPFGYPGDFMMMNYVYDGADYGESLFDRFLHRLGLRSSHFLFTRMQSVRGHVEKIIDSKQGAPVHILSLASGSAEDLVSYLAMGKPSGPLHLTLVDQDVRALSFSYERAYPHVAARGDGSTLQCLHTSFTRLLKGSDFSADLPKQDLIYSVGLLDYLKPRRAKLLAESLYEQVTEGGSMLIGNLRESHASCRWVTEMMCDWDLIFRTEQDMIDLSADLAFTDQEVTIDETGQVYLLTLRKP